MLNSQETLIPCPFSSSYKIPVHQAWQLLGVFLIYRFVIACLFSGLFFFNVGPSLLGNYQPFLYAVTSGIYLLITVIQGVAVLLRKPAYSFQAQLQIFVDLISLTLLMHACGGIVSGIGILLAVSVAATGLLVGSRCAFIFAALASLFILTEQVYADLTNAFEQTAYTYSGMLGASFFTISLLAHILANRAEENAAIAEQRGVDIANLQHLNEYVIQHLQSGIIVLDQEHTICMMNGAALRLFKLPSYPNDRQTIPAEISGHYDHWLSNRKGSSVTISTKNGLDVDARFTKLGENNSPFNMIFLEDRALSNQRVQQSKLASLGHLAASIAHEIRNPLGAISHASQLLAESPTLNEEDIRLTQIIKNHTSRVNGIIESVMQMARRTPPQREEIEIVSWFRKFLQEFAVEQELKSLPFELKVGANEFFVCIDPGHLKQILDNLCTNAMKYGGTDHGKISIVMNSEDQYHCIQVLDRGPGISQENVEKIFEPFFTTSNSGTGLGLYICRELAELNRANLAYEPVAGGGSSFKLCLPKAETTVIEI